MNALTPEAVHAALQQKLVALKDPADATTDRERERLRATRHEIQMHLASWPNLADRLGTPTARRAIVEAELRRLRAVEKTLDKRIAEAKAADSDHQTALVASKTALQRGCEYWDGQAIVPGPLRELLTPEPCGACHRPYEVAWLGPIASL